MRHFASLFALAWFVVGCASSPAVRREEALERWSENHPEAARELGVWVREHPNAAPLFFEWDGHHPEKSREFVFWTIASPAQPLEAFVAAHPGWPLFDRIMESHRPAAETFMAWCRRHPPAAQALMAHPGALDWAGRHLYAADWHMETTQ
jgi:hypothetical protein